MQQLLAASLSTLLHWRDKSILNLHSQHKWVLKMASKVALKHMYIHSIIKNATSNFSDYMQCQVWELNLPTFKEYVQLYNMLILYSYYHPIKTF
jgi:hypothetical protein